MAVLMLTGIAASVACADDSSAVVAEVNGHQLTRAELDKRESGDLLQAKYKYYMAEKQAVDKLVREELLNDAAKKEGVSVEELLKRHIGEVKAPTDDQVEVFYEGMQSDKSLPEIHDDIRQHIVDLRRQKAATAYLETLRTKGDVKVEIEPPTTTVSSTAGAPTLGPADAPVKIIEYADYQCPYCKQMHPLIKRLREEFPKTQLVYEDFPLPMHANAEKAAEAAHCAGDQGKYWEFHDAIFDHSGSLDVTNLKGIAKTVKLDQTSFDQCLDSGKHAPDVAKGQIQGTGLGITGTPTFFINGHMVTGAAKYETLKEIVAQESSSNPGAQALAK